MWMKKLLFSLTILFLLFHSLTLPLSARAADCAQDYKKYFFPDAGSCSTYQAACNPAGPFYEKFGNDEESCLSAFGIANLTFQSPTGGSKWYMQTPQEFSRKVLDPSNNEIFGERYTFAQINWIINSIFTILSPTAGAQKPEDMVNFLLQIQQIIKSTSSLDASSNTASLIQTSPLALAIPLIEYPYKHPIASGIAETKRAVATLNPIAPVLAQGVGTEKLNTSNAIFQLWTATRNIAYLVTALLLVASGFLVMFRTQVAPQTVVTIQLIIPKLVASLILITFSYAIVGFVIDMIYVINASSVSLLNFANPNLFNGNGAQNAINLLIRGDFSFVTTFLSMPVTIAIVLVLLLAILGMVISAGPIALTALLGGPLGVAAATAGGIVVVAAIGVGVVSATIGVFAWAIYVSARIIGQLLLAYLNLIILTITGPLQIMMDVLPTKKDVGFKSWIMCVIGNASVFVTYAILALVASAIFGYGIGDLGNSFNPDNSRLDQSFTLPGVNFNLDFRFNNTNFFLSMIWWLLLAMGFFTATPDIVAKVKSGFCKEDDYSKFIESLVKDTFGQITKAGQETGKGVGEQIRTDQATRATTTDTTPTTNERPA
jgi:hypothetical protein